MRVILFSLNVTLLFWWIWGCSPKFYPPAPKDELVAKGRELFFNETFDGNGRTCGTCHPASNNFTIDRAFIATLPDDDPLFVAETDPNLNENFENPVLIRQFGLILENIDGFNDLSRVFTMRGVPHTLGLSQSVNSENGPMTGWSGDGAPGDGSLRSFATGAVIQHFTKTINRIPGVDFRLPTDEELDALEAFQLSLGRRDDLQLPLPLKGIMVSKGQEIFNDVTTGKCFACHFNAGANGAQAIFGENAGNMNFNTGVEDLPDQPADLTGELIPHDDGFGTPGNGEFNTPPVVESADTGPFFHNSSVETIEGAVAFYNGEAFNNSPAGELLTNATGSGINLDATQVEEVAAFLRVINAVENIRQGIEFLLSYSERDFLGNVRYEDLIGQARTEIEDAVRVLRDRGLHPEAVKLLDEALEEIAWENIKNARYKKKKELARSAVKTLERARGELIETP